MINSLNGIIFLLLAVDANKGLDANRWDPVNWDHWLLITCFSAIATGGLWLSWQLKERKHLCC